MAAAGQMAEFFATLGFKVNQADIKKVDKTLDYIEKRVRKMVEGDLDNLRVNITGFRFSEGFNTRLYKALQKKMTIVNNKKGLSPEITISKFDVDRNAFLREMKVAATYVENNLRVRIRPDAGMPVGGPIGGGRTGGRASGFAGGMGAGAAAGSLGRGFIPGLGVAFGVSQMNRINQELIGQNLAATAVFGNEEAGKEQLDWVRNLGNKIGFDYRSQANPYMKMAAAGTTAGMGTGQVQEIFTGMAEYGRVMGLNDEDMKGSMRAVEQMLNKGQVYAEELKMQLGEKFPAAIQLMAEAVSGGDTEKLFDMMEKGEVSSIEALPKFAKILSRQARVGGALTEAMKTSLAEQMRFNNTFNDLVMFLSKAGFEEGQAGIFRTMADFFMEMKPLLSAFGEMWLYVADVLRIPLGLFVDLGRGLEGLSKYTGLAKGQLLGLGTVVAGLMFPLTRVFTLITIGLAALEDFTAFLSGRGSLIGKILGEDAEGVRSSFLSLFETVTSTVKQLFEVVGNLIDLFGETDLPLVNVLKDLIESMELLFEMLNRAMGGDSKEVRAAKREQEYVAGMGTNPALAMGSGPMSSAKGKSGGFTDLLAMFIEKNPMLAIPESWGAADMVRNFGDTEGNNSELSSRMSELQGMRSQYDMGSGSQPSITVNVDATNAQDPAAVEAAGMRAGDAIVQSILNNYSKDLTNRIGESN